MKTFFFYGQYQKGRLNRVCTIYQVKRNTPVYVGKVQFSTASTTGDSSEVFQKLMELGYIPKKAYKLSQRPWSGAGYYCKEVEELGYKIFEL